MYIAIDTETTGSDFWHGCKPFYVSSCTEKGIVRTWEWDIDPLTRIPIIPEDEIEEIQELLDNTTNKIVFHNAKFDIRALESIGITNIPWDRIHDTHILSHVWNSLESHKLKDLANRIGDIDTEDEKDLNIACNQARKIASKLGWDIAKLPHKHLPSMKKSPPGGMGVLDKWIPRQLASHLSYPSSHPWHTVNSKYAIKDAERTIVIWTILQPYLKERDLYKLYLDRRKLLEVTYKMESRGISFSKDKIESEIARYKSIQKLSESKCYKLGGKINLSSPKQLEKVLFQKFKLDPVRFTKNGISTDKFTIDTLLESSKRVNLKAHKFLTNFKKYKKATSAQGYLVGYLNACHEYMLYPSYRRLHPSFNICGTGTTRLSSSEPNAQNIGTREEINLRSVFGPLPGRVWYSLDYDNIEMRIFGYESKDKDLIKTFEDGKSAHMVFAYVLHEKEIDERGYDDFKENSINYKMTKNGNFALLYGAGAGHADKTYGVKGAYRKIRKMLPKVDSFMAEKQREAERKSYITTKGGYPLYVPQEEPYKAVNYFVQGSAGWAMIKAMIRVDKYISSFPDHYLIMTIHDELILDFPDKNPKGNTIKIKEIKRIMELSGKDIDVPLKASTSIIETTWDKKTSLKF